MDKQIRMPSMRFELIGCLEDFSNKEVQDKGWVDPNYPHVFWSNVILCSDATDCFDPIIDHGESEDFQEGNILFNSEETEAVMKTMRAFRKVIEEVGIDKSDETYINSSLWHDVIKKSKKAYDLLIKNNEKHGLFLKSENDLSDQELQQSL